MNQPSPDPGVNQYLVVYAMPSKCPSTPFLLFVLNRRGLCDTFCLRIFAQICTAIFLCGLEWHCCMIDSKMASH